MTMRPMTPDITKVTMVITAGMNKTDMTIRATMHI